MVNETYFRIVDEDCVSNILAVWGRRSKDSKLFLEWLCNFVENIFADVDYMWVGYEIIDPFAPVFVAVVKSGKQNTYTLHNGFLILQRSKGHISDEAQDVLNKELATPLKFTEYELVSIQKCLSKHTDNLMTKHSNLLIVSASKIKSKNYGNEEAKYDIETCIVFYVHVKGIIPFNEDAFPKELDGFPVDVREGTFKTFSNASDFHERLLMGCQIVTAYNMTCSLGGFVELDYGKIGCLTCFHPFETEASVADFKRDPVNQSYLRKGVYQPAPKPEFEFGKLVNSIKYSGDSDNIGVDAALIEITKPDRYPCTGTFPDGVSQKAGVSTEKPMVFHTGKIIERFEDIPKPCKVVKYGAGTGHTIGKLRLVCFAVRKYSSSFYLDDRVRLHQQLEVDSIEGQVFADEGDSGSLVFVLKDMEFHALGLLVGGTNYGTTIVTPIWAVLNRLNLPLKFLSFENSVGCFEDPVNQRFKRIESDVDLLKQNAEVTKQMISSLENKVDITDRKQDERSASMENKVSSLENKMDVTDRKQDERSALIENKVSSLENKLDVIDRKQDERSASIDTKVNSLENKIDEKIDTKLTAIYNIVCKNKLS